MSEVKQVKEKVTNEYNAMLNGLKKLGFELIYSHSTGEGFWGWHDLTFKPTEFDQEKFINASKVIFKYDDAFTELARKHNLL